MGLDLPIRVSAIWAETQRTLSSPEYALVLALSEGVSLQGQKKTAIIPGTLLFLAPFSGQKLHMAPGSHAIYAVIPADVLESLVGIPKRASMTLLQEGSDSAREKLIEYFDIVCNQREVSPLVKTRVAYELLCALEPSIASAMPEKQPVASTISTRIPHILAYVEANFRQSLQLSDLAEEFSVSRQYLSTVFHRELGVPFSEYLTGLRLEEAYRLLLTTSDNVTTISHNSGFPNLKALNQAFRTRYGISPKDFRKQKITAMEPEIPEGNVLRDINQLLRPYRLVYQKYESAVRTEEIAVIGEGVPLRRNWNILNIDNASDCLQSSVQASLAAMQREMDFRYVRLLNLLSDTTTPYIPSLEKYRFTGFLQVLEFFRKIGLTPILVLGERYDVMTDGILLGEGYQLEPAVWYRYLGELLDISIDRWGKEWVSTWRMEFHMPERLHGAHDSEGFMDLLEQSISIIRNRVPEIRIGGPGLAVDSLRQERLDTWFREVRRRNLDVDYVSVELWADYHYAKHVFSDQRDGWRELHTLESLQSADNSLPKQKLAWVREIMKRNDMEHLPVIVSAFGITKYQAESAQWGGHCGSYLIKCCLELSDLVDGVGCWKAMSAEAEYISEYQILGSGCGLTGRYDLKNINWYAQHFLTGLMPYVLLRGMHCIVTTDRKGSFAVIIHNCKSYSGYFCRHYPDQDARSYEDPRLYTSTAALEQTVKLLGAKPGAYTVTQHLIGDHHGCVSTVLRQMGEFRIPGDHEIEYLYGQSLPYQHTYRVEAAESLDFAVTLQANEVMLLRIHPAE